MDRWPHHATALNELTATEIVRGIAAGEITCEAVTRDCLDRIAAREGDVHAWATIDPELALAQARALDRAPRARAAAWRADRRQGHHRHLRPADRDGLADLQGPPAGRRRRLRRARARGRRRDPRQDRHLRIRRHDAGRRPPTRTIPRTRRAARRAARPPRSPTAWCRRRSAPRPAARCCGRRPIAACSATSRPSTCIQPRAASIRRPRASTPSGSSRASLDDVELISAVLELRKPPAQPSTLDARAPHRALPHAAVGHRAAGDRARGRGRRRAARHGRRVGARDRAAGGILRPAQRRARDHQQLRARRRAWRTNGTRTATRSARCCGKRIELGLAMPHEDYLAALAARAKTAARGSPQVFDGIDVHARALRQGRGAARSRPTPAIRPSRRSGPCSTRPAMTLPTHRGPNGLPVGIQLVAQRYDDDRLFACARWVWDKLGAPEGLRDPGRGLKGWRGRRGLY